MSMYQTLELQVYNVAQEAWVRCPGTEASNRPHHYDVLRARFQQAVTEARQDPDTPAGVRIVGRAGRTIDVWLQGLDEEPERRDTYRPDQN